MATDNFGLTFGIAVYGALVATANVVINVIRELKEAPKLSVDVRVGNYMWFSLKTQQHEVRADSLNMLITVTNIGRRPVQVTHIGGELKAPEQGKREFVLIPSPGNLPKLLKEHESLSQSIEGTESIKKLFSNTSRFFASDITGKNHYVSKHAFEKACRVAGLS